METGHGASPPDINCTQATSSTITTTGNDNLHIDDDVCEDSNKETELSQEESDLKLINFFERETIKAIAQKNQTIQNSPSHIGEDVIESAYKLLCGKKVLLYDHLIKRKSSEEPKSHHVTVDFNPSPSDIIVSRDGNKHVMNFIQNSVVKQCSMYAFEDLCTSMANILANIKKKQTMTQHQFRKMKSDIHLASGLLSAVKNLTHGMFLGNGGSYTKRLYHRKISETNSSKFLIKDTKMCIDDSSARKKVQTFLCDLKQSSSDTSSFEVKPKRVTVSKGNENNIGKYTVLKDDKVKLTFFTGESIVINAPMSVEIYSPEEILCLLSEKIEPNYHNRVMKLISFDLGVGLIPISYEGMRKAWYRYRKYNVFNKYWRNTGRKPIATKEEIDEFKKKAFEVSANTLSDKQIEMFLNKKKRQLEAGKNNFSPRPIAQSTLGIYKAYVRADYNVIEKKFVNYKDEVRYAAETSLRMVVSYIMAVAVTHLLPGNPCPSHPANHKYGTDGSKLLADLVCKAEGVPNVYPINPAYITSTDDTVLFISDLEEENDPSQIRLALRDTDEKSRNMKSKNYFVTAKKCKTMGIRVRLTYTFSANGSTAPLYVVISGMKESEMPSSHYPSGIHIEKVPGLSTASAIDPDVEKCGYIVFVRSGKKANAEKDHNADNTQEEDREEMADSENNYDNEEEAESSTGMQNSVRYYAKNILLPFIESQRKKCSYNHTSKDEDDVMSNAWFDGDINQVKVFSSNEMLEKADELNINFNKQNAKRTTCEQGADTGEMFKLLNYTTKKRKMLDLPMSHIFGNIHQLFTKLSREKHIKIDSRKRRLLISFISDLPQISLLSTSRKTVTTAFLRNGQLDSNDHLWPDINQMLSTLGYKLSDEHFHLVFDNFQMLYEYMRDNGNIPEMVFNALNFPHDTTPTGEIIHRDYSISQEWCQRAKVMSSKFQQNLRKERFTSIRDQQQEKLATETGKRRKKLELSKKAEDKIICKMNALKADSNKRARTNHAEGMTNSSNNGTTTPITNIRDCQIEAFDEPNNEELQAFIHVRKFESTRIPRSRRWKYPNKKTVQFAKDGEHCLILVAFELRDKPVIFSETPPQTS